MKCIVRFVLPATLVLALGALPAGVGGQSAGLVLGSVWNSGRDLTRANEVGGWVSPWRRLVLAGEWRWGGEVRPDVLCAGLIPPGTGCPEEATQLDVRMAEPSLGYRFQPTSGGTWSAGVTPRVGVVWIESKRFGQQTRRSTQVHRALVTLGLGAELERVLGGVAVGLGVRGSTSPGSNFRCSDCYTASFEKGFLSVALDGRLSFVRRR